jgi:hypothetical protein
MTKTKKALIIIGAIIFVPVITVIVFALYEYVYLSVAFKTEMKNGGHIDHKKYKDVFYPDELILHSCTNKCNVGIVKRGLTSSVVPVSAV